MCQVFKGIYTPTWRLFEPYDSRRQDWLSRRVRRIYSARVLPAATFLESWSSQQFHFQSSRTTLFSWRQKCLHKETADVTIFSRRLQKEKFLEMHVTVTISVRCVHRPQFCIWPSTCHIVSPGWRHDMSFLEAEAMSGLPLHDH